MILSDIRAHREIAPAGSAIRVPLHAVEVTARAIRDILDDPVSAAARSRLARQSIAERPIVKVGDDFEGLYAGVVARRSTRSRARDRVPHAE